MKFYKNSSNLNTWRKWRSTTCQSTNSTSKETTSATFSCRTSTNPKTTSTSKTILIIKITTPGKISTRTFSMRNLKMAIMIWMGTWLREDLKRAVVGLMEGIIITIWKNPLYSILKIFNLVRFLEQINP